MHMKTALYLLIYILVLFLFSLFSLCHIRLYFDSWLSAQCSHMVGLEGPCMVPGMEPASKANALPAGLSLQHTHPTSEMRIKKGLLFSSAQC